jgi:hypothetical protein
MILSAIDCFYILMIAVIFGFIIHLESKVNQLVSMMEEHIKVDERLCEISQKLDN